MAEESIGGGQGGGPVDGGGGGGIPSGGDGGAPAGGGSEPSSLRDDVARAFEQVGSAEDQARGVKPGERGRDSTGRFMPGQRRPAAPLPNGAAQAAGKTAMVPADTGPLKAPASWKPNLREHWNTLAPDVQAEIHRREGEINKALQASAGARQALEHMQRVIGPYAHNIRASGSDAVGAIANFFQADHVLRHGQATEKAQLVSNIIRQYGVDLVTLDTILAGQVPKQDPQNALLSQLRQEMQAQLQPMQGFFSQIQQRQQQAAGQVQADAHREVEAFGAQEQNEFFNDLREDMADILDMATKRGQIMTLQEAYDRASKLHPQISEIVGKRAETQAAENAARAASRARRTAASLVSGPAPVGTGGAAGQSLRDAVEAAWHQHSAG